MHITPTVKIILETAPAKVLATKGPEDINVVPVSMIKVNESSIWLFDFFMDKTAQNARARSVCALAAWEGVQGVQLKGDVTYVTAGEVFAEAVAWVHTQNPDRVVSGVLVIVPTAIFDISLDRAYTTAELGIE
jgi:predicted pyridoxine 5'-phosphate oxidase superfamily flavin-nucleotide-binding protein